MEFSPPLAARQSLTGAARWILRKQAGSFGHEAQDAKTFADWGFDYLKYDWCSYSQKQFGHGVWKTMPPYWIMGRALAHQKRDGAPAEMLK